MQVSQAVRENTWKVVFGSSGAIIAVVTALFALDARYAHAADVEKDKRQTQQIITETSQTLRQQMLEDKLFELDVKKEQSPTQRLSPVDAALHSRYKRQLEEISAKRRSPHVGNN